MYERKWYELCILSFYFIVLREVHTGSRTCSKYYETDVKLTNSFIYIKVALSCCAIFWLTNLSIHKSTPRKMLLLFFVSLHFNFFFLLFFCWYNQLQKSAVRVKTILNTIHSFHDGMLSTIIILVTFDGIKLKKKK